MTQRCVCYISNRSPGRGGGGGGFNISALRDAVAVADLLGVGVVLDNPTEAWTMPDEIARTGSMAIVQPRARVRRNKDLARPNGSSA